MRFAYDLGLPDWQQWTRRSGQPDYRAGQIFRWLARGIAAAEEMTDLPAALRSQLAADFDFTGFQLVQKLQSSLDATCKYVFRLSDGNTIESVLMHYRHGWSACISSQAGCRMGCAFCASSGAGFGRNLSAGEMLAQVARISRDLGSRVGHLVVMGIGEPFDNYEPLVRFLRLVNDPEGQNIGFRHISVSTCGLVPEMLKFTQEGMPVTLSVSLHAPNDVIRRQLMPIARRYSLDQLLSACRRHTDLTGRRISFEYAMIQGINDRPEHAAELAGRLRGMLAHVNLIPVNEVPGSAFRQSPPETVRQFRDRLAHAGINVTVRRELGTDIMAACGQLRRNAEGCGSP